MGASDLNEMWQIVRDNEKTIAVVSARLGATDEAVKKLVADAEAMKAILNRAIGAKTFAGVVGAVVGSILTLFFAWLSVRR